MLHYVRVPQCLKRQRFGVAYRREQLLAVVPPTTRYYPLDLVFVEWRRAFRIVDLAERDAIERPEALDAGCIMLTGLDRDTILAGIATVTALFAERTRAALPHPVPDDYRIADTSARVVSLILGTARLSNAWDGIRPND